MKKPFPVLQTKRMVLRHFDEEDVTNVFEGLSHPEVIKYYGVSYDTLEATAAQMDWFANLEQTGTGCWWAICNKQNGTFVGAGGLNELDRKQRKAELGFWLLPDYWGQGIMQETIPAILAHAFSTLDLHRIEGFVEHQNKNCKKALAKLGFTHEGTMRDCEIKNEAFISLDIYAKFAHPTHTGNE